VALDFVDDVFPGMLVPVFLYSGFWVAMQCSYPVVLL
jgi:hypothetical protein